ncbi:hypothetical protein CTAYLR_005311 [Chrysophaeum taylorii]|uniref:sn-1-specific diacylglycerol lipase n=1 Tax=Chrysophaeum taylorii TaxID=2483200 RepID=A0AAD7UJ65_9STRA|nr:hypothetical protein CTAYLR_005311 [Chrysophaeum taylorii]
MPTSLQVVRTVTVGVVLVGQGTWASAERSVSSFPWSERALRRLMPTEALDAMEKINEALLQLRGARGCTEGRRASELLDVLVLHEYERCSEEASSSTAPQKKADSLDASFVRWCWRCASAAYGFAVLKGLGLLPGAGPASMGDVLQLDDIAVQHRCGDAVVVKKSNPKKPATRAPAFFVAYSPSRRAVVVSVRGTADVGDALTDLVCGAKPLAGDPSRLAHAGIADAATAVLREVDDAAAEALAGAPPGTPLVFTGHSLGGGVALVAAVLASERAGLAPRLEARLGDREVRAVAFSPPPVVTPGADRANLVSLFVGDDVVPSLSLRSVSVLLRELDVLDESLSRRARLELLLASKLASNGVVNALVGDNDDWLHRQRRNLRRAVDDAAVAARRDFAPDDDAPALRVPGRVFRLARDGACTTVDTDHAEPRIRIRDRLLVDHIPPTLEAAIDALARRCDDDDFPSPSSSSS